MVDGYVDFSAGTVTTCYATIPKTTTHPKQACWCEGCRLSGCAEAGRGKGGAAEYRAGSVQAHAASSSFGKLRTIVDAGLGSASPAMAVRSRRLRPPRPPLLSLPPPPPEVRAAPAVGATADDEEERTTRSWWLHCLGWPRPSTTTRIRLMSRQRLRTTLMGMVEAMVTQAEVNRRISCRSRSRRRRRQPRSSMLLPPARCLLSIRCPQITSTRGTESTFACVLLAALTGAPANLWTTLCRKLWPPPADTLALLNALSEIRRGLRGEWTFEGFVEFLRDELSVGERSTFFSLTLPHLCSLALRMPALFTSPLPLLLRGRAKRVCLTPEQCGCLLAHAFFCSFPYRGDSSGGGGGGGGRRQAASGAPSFTFAVLHGRMHPPRHAGPI